MTTTSVRRHLLASPQRVYDALVSPAAIAAWRVPASMTSEVHEFEPREGGRIRVSLTYDTPDPAGKSSRHTDTYSGRFVRLDPPRLVVEEDEFESDDPAFLGVMRITFTLTEADGGTELVAVHEGCRPASPPRTTRRAGGSRSTGWPASSSRTRV
ncbi:SRPBCC domain-containing protein [Naasia aerilata]|uniref:Activator of Hsp90 ATPase homologue 1/2-like C-terminal domain-containing protein n=1 Tax=Naasia aerilata TaxID=1162966 RepID=A0ABM8GDW5_9MICO|nr:SRPBCC domain-containing protein [Naasia aerilata]BDZ46485.1 hypothetical protein GCM10025866_23940 [Naasia aerilata]